MVTWAHARLLAAVGFLLLALLPWSVQAGTADAPEITDDADDHVLGPLPIGMSTQFRTADILSGWIVEEADNLLFNIEIQGTGASGTAGPYSWDFHATANGADVVMGATSTADQPTPTGVATAAALEAGVVTLTVPRSAFGGATQLTALFIASSGGTPPQMQPDVVIGDTAPDGGADGGISYTVTGGSSGTPGDADGDGLNDTWEVDQFGSVTLHNGTGDPDADGLNNSAEFTAGTNATRPDTDGDFVSDGEDPFPLDPTRPVDFDGDGLNDTWEREHFTSIDAQNGTGDPDGDGLSNAAEQARGTDPNQADTDQDGFADAVDRDPLDPSVGGASEAASSRQAEPELYAGAFMFALAATFILLGLAKGI